MTVPMERCVGSNKKRIGRTIPSFLRGEFLERFQHLYPYLCVTLGADVSHVGFRSHRVEVAEEMMALVS